MRLSRASKVTVIVPTYGHAPFIAQCLESLLTQTHPPAHIIVVNDGSPDDTDNVVLPYLRFIEYHKHTHQGIARTMNRALELARTDYLHMIGSDDWLAPNAFEMLEQALDRNSDVAVAHASHWKVDSEGHATLIPCVENTGKYPPLPALIMENGVWAPTVMMRRCVLDDGYRIPDFHFCQDWAMTMTIALRGWRFFGIATPLGYYRRHANNTTHARYQREIVEDEIAMLQWMRSTGNVPASLDPVFERSILWRQRSLIWMLLASNQRYLTRTKFEKVWASGHRDWNTWLLALAVHLPSRVYRLAHMIGGYRPQPRSARSRSSRFPAG